MDLKDFSISYSTFVRAEPERVYDGIAVAEELDGWFTKGAEVDARAGGSIRFRWDGFGLESTIQEDGGPVLEARRPERFVFQWHPDNPSYATTVEIDFKAVDGGTLVRVREHGFQNTPEGMRAMLACAGGWGEALTLWKFFIEHGLRY